MKVRSVHLRNFKKFRDKFLDFTDSESGLSKDLIVLLGENGSGKSTVLQVIAAAVGFATKRLESPKELDWPGFDLELADKSWQFPGVVEIQIEFSQDEILATSEFYEKVPGLMNRPEATPPGNSNIVELILEGGKADIGKNARERFQFMGREYAKQIHRFSPESFSTFRRIGGVFWYTEQRTATSLNDLGDNGDSSEKIISLGKLRRTLSRLFDFHQRVKRREHELRPGERDIFANLDQTYRAVFPARGLEGPLPQTEIGQILEEPRFYLHDRHRQYELAEMSGGERAIFPLILDFANWEIHNSVILIDELELHLHPPIQQALLRALSHLGNNNQFIVTTHSDAVEALVPTESIIRLGDD